MVCVSTSLTSTFDKLFNLCANEPEKPYGICCVITIGGKSSGKDEKTLIKDSTPPVDEPMPIILPTPCIAGVLSNTSSG